MMDKELLVKLLESENEKLKDEVRVLNKEIDKRDYIGFGLAVVISFLLFF